MMAGATRPARAQADADHPPLAPARDVQVEYSVQPDGAPAPKTIEAWFTANGGMMRIDSPEGMGSTILNRTTRQVTIVLNKQKVYTQFDARNGIRNPFLLDLQMQYTRKGTARVAGVPCTEWGVVSGRGTATACVTDDGVILREDGVDGDGMKGRLEATRVIYGPLPASTFQPPAGYQMVTRHRVAPSHALGGGQPVTGGTAQSGR
nr:DUF4412 domain-containing protein [Gluconacetobacter sacchari]